MDNDILEELQLLREDVKAVNNSINSAINGAVAVLVAYIVVKYLISLS